MPKRRKKHRHRLLDIVDLPAETAGEPRITQVGRAHLLVENHKGVFEFLPGILRLKTRDGLLCVRGEGLVIRELSAERMLVSGSIDGVGFDTEHSSRG